MPFVGGIIARISKGRTIRQVILATLLLPLLSAVMLNRFPPTIQHLNLLALPIFNYGIPLIGALILVALFGRETTGTHLMFGRFRGNRPAKYRNPVKFLELATSAMVFVMLLYMSGGVSVIEYSIVMVFPVFVITLLIFLSLLRYLSRQKNMAASSLKDEVSL